MTMPIDNAGAHKKELAFKGKSCLVQARKDGHRQRVGLYVRQGAVRRPNQKRVARRPNLDQASLDGLDDFSGFQNLSKWAAKSVNEKPSDDEGYSLSIRSRRTVWVDGPTVYALIFGDAH